MGLKQIIEESDPLQDGQTELDVRIIRRLKVQKPIEVTVSEARPLSSAVASLFGNTVEPITDLQTYKDKHVRTEQQRFRWMKPDGNGGLVPR